MHKRKLLPALLALLLFAAPFAGAEEKEIRLTFTGDVTLGCEEVMQREDYSLVGYAAAQGEAYFFSKVKALFEEDDLTVVNLEGVLSDTHRGENKKKNFRFRGPTALAGALTAGSIEAVNTANNHTMDYGAKGFESTIAALDAHGVAHFGERETYVFEKDGVRIAFLGMYAEDYRQKKSWAQEEMARLREETNAIVFSFHAGREYAENRIALQEEMARFAIDNGADLVIMHHPHVVQGMDVYKNRSILYSLGNFCFGGNRHAKVLESLVVTAELTFDEDGAYLGQQLALYPAYTTGVSTHNDYQPRLVTGEEAENVLRLVQQDTPFALPQFDETTGCVAMTYLPAR